VDGLFFQAAEVLGQLGQESIGQQVAALGEAREQGAVQQFLGGLEGRGRGSRIGETLRAPPAVLA